MDGRKTGVDGLLCDSGSEGAPARAVAEDWALVAERVRFLTVLALGVDEAGAPGVVGVAVVFVEALREVEDLRGLSKAVAALVTGCVEGEGGGGEWEELGRLDCLVERMGCVFGGDGAAAAEARRVRLLVAGAVGEGL